jgi:hypothetical protein
LMWRRPGHCVLNIANDRSIFCKGRDFCKEGVMIVKKLATLSGYFGIFVEARVD